MAWALTDQSIVLEGDVYIKRLDVSGAEFELMGNVPSFKISNKSSKIERKGKRKGAYGKVLSSINKDLETNASFTTDTLTAKNVALYLLRQKLTLSQTTGTDLTETLTLKSGQFKRLQKKMVSNVRITGKVEGTDFQVDGDGGMVLAIPGGSITDGASVTVTYNCEAIVGEKVGGAAVAEIPVELYLVGINKDSATAQRVMVEIPYAKLAPKGDVDLFADKFESVEFDVSILVPTDGRDDLTVSFT